ncbi:hypothetical protein CLV62_12078 [Dysgonomonas alginatilytica]|uniref:Uncharacterized protein n=2 Tax=Dysgonomonas alginatilytica TaxID=1605892 RepID=A0A2V3PN28_9BACT|nr:hypothetical protein CLV62_12078 [Dysgonomonas alginatilytica]
MIQMSVDLVSKSLAENNPYDIDDCISGFRFIVEFKGNEDNVGILTADVLDSDWLLNIEASQLLRNEVQILLNTRNTEYRYLLNQANEIQRDRLEEIGINIGL